MESDHQVRFLKLENIKFISKKDNKPGQFSQLHVLCDSGDVFKFILNDNLVLQCNGIKVLEPIQIRLKKNSFNNQDSVIDIGKLK